MKQQTTDEILAEIRTLKIEREQYKNALSQLEVKADAARRRMHAVEDKIARLAELPARIAANEAWEHDTHQ